MFFFKVKGIVPKVADVTARNKTGSIGRSGNFTAMYSVSSANNIYEIFEYTIIIITQLYVELRRICQ